MKAREAEDDFPHDTDADFAALLELSIELVESRNGKPIPPGQEWTNDRQTLAKKFIYHLATIQTLRSGMTLKAGGKEQRHVDHGSIIVLLRAAVENYIVFAWVLGNPTEARSKFRHSTWRYAGLMDRLGRHAITEYGRIVQARERPEAEELLREIKAHPVFTTLTSGQQRAIINKSDWRLGRQWAQLADDVGLSDGYFRTTYSYLCDYSHSSYAAALQVGQADMQAQNGIAKSMMGVACLCMAHFIQVLIGLDVTLREMVRRSAAAGTVDKWSFGRERLDEFFPSKMKPASPDAPGADKGLA